MYPPIEPYRHGMLDVGGENLLYWEECGDPDGKPALVLHGGPGSGATPGWRRFFDPDHYRVVLFDQRNCGRSTPHAADPSTDLSTNTTQHLLSDIELLRTELDIDRWLLFGASWGSVLGLAYAERHPAHVTEIIMFGVATGRQTEVDLLVRGLAPMFPQAWERFHAGAAGSNNPDLPAAYHELLNSPDAAVRERAAVEWCAWEDALVPTTGAGARYRDPWFRLGFARLVTHYWSHGHFLPDGDIIANAGRLAGIPGVLVQGTLDLGNLVGTPWLLAHAWPGCELILVDEAGHETETAGMGAALVAQTDRFASPS
jgi:proline iminopeptidase